MREIIERVARCFHDWVFVASGCFDGPTRSMTPRCSEQNAGGGFLHEPRRRLRSGISWGRAAGDRGGQTRRVLAVFFRNFFEAISSPLEFQAVFFQLSNAQARPDLDRPTRCRHIQKIDSVPPNLRPDSLQPTILQPVIQFDIPTVSGINSVPDTAELSREYSGYHPDAGPRASHSPQAEVAGSPGLVGRSRATAAPAAMVSAALGRSSGDFPPRDIDVPPPAHAS